MELFFEVLQARIELYGGAQRRGRVSAPPYVAVPLLGYFLRAVFTESIPFSSSLSHSQELGLECAPAYFKYGSCLFYKAQDEADFLGAPMQDAANQRDGIASGSVRCLRGLGGRVVLDIWPI